jgi:hypothetical protein
MRLLLLTLVLVAQNCAAKLPAPGEEGAPNDPRYCGEPTRDANGRITRSTAMLRAFVLVFPCPATLKHVTSCRDWQIDHVVPRADGGCDIPLNMQWLPVAIKTCKSSACKDRWERHYHAFPREIVQP